MASGLVSGASASSAQSVHFETTSGGAPGEKPRRSLRPRRQKRRPQPPIPLSVYGLYLPDENMRLIGRKVLPQFVRDAFSDIEDKVLLSAGQHYSNAHCQDRFPEIPLRWRQTVLVHADDCSRPLVVLGHRNTKKDAKIYVNEEQMEKIRDYLELGEQEPDWYDVICTG